MILLAVAGAGCGQIDKQEAAYRDNFKTMWDKTAVMAGGLQKQADAAYAAGDIDAVVADYKKLSALYKNARVSLAKRKAPAGYAPLAAKTIGYLNAGEAYYNKLAATVETTGGNYGNDKVAEIKSAQATWDAATRRLEKELANKRFKLG